jgi:hypothetical protein
MKSIAGRLARIEAAAGPVAAAEYVEVLPGQSEEEAIRMRYGDGPLPAALFVVILTRQPHRADPSS